MNYVWNIEFEEHWSYHGRDEFEADGLAFTVAASNSDEAISKATVLAEVGITFKSDDGEDITLEAIRVINVERAQTLDA